MTLKDVLISGKFTGDVSIDGAHMSLKDMLIAAKLHGGSSPVPVANKYITSNTQTTITLPFGPQASYKIIYDLYAIGALAGYEDISTYNGDRTGALGIKTQQQCYLYRGGWNYAETPTWPRYTPITKITTDYTTRTLSAVAGGELKAVDDSANRWPTSTNPFTLYLNSDIKIKRITVDSEGATIHDLIATDDGGACLKDLVTGICYYDANSTAYLIDDPQ